MDFVTLVIIAIVLSATSLVLSELLRPKPKFESARPAGLGDFRFPTATEGRPVPLVFGTVKIDGPNVVWYGGFTQTPIHKTIKTGLWSSKHLTTGYHYFIGIMMALARGPGCVMKKILIGDKVVHNGTTSTAGSPIALDEPGLFGGDDLGEGGVEGTVRFYPGTEDQPQNSYMASILGGANLPSYRGTCYVVFEGGYIGNSTSIRPWSFELARLVNPLGIPDGKHVVNDHDMNPMTVLYELITDTDWGCGEPTSTVDTDNFLEAAETLYGELNGFSMLWDSDRPGSDLKHEVERQINGILYFDMTDGKWRVKLTRADYVIGDVPQLVSGQNILRIQDFTRGTWDETANQVRIQYYNRGNQYGETFAGASDLANQRIQGGTIIPSNSALPGVKYATLANRIASRTLKSLSTPLAKANVVVDRTLWDLHVGDAVAWTDEGLGFDQMAFRVTSVDFGNLLEGEVRLGLVQDVYGFQAEVFGESEDTLWEEPTQAVDPFPVDEQLVIEAPFALTRRDPVTPGVSDRIFAAGRRQTGAETSFQMFERHSAGTPSGPFSLFGEVFGFMLVGELTADILPGPSSPQASISVDPDPDTSAAIHAAFTQSPTATDLGQNLTNLILVDDEFMAVTSTVDNTTSVDLVDVYRGMLDTAPSAHAAGSRVYLVFAGAGLSDSAVPQGDNVDVKLRPKSRTDQVAEAEAATISLAMNRRACRPYPPVEMALNGVSWDDAVSFDALLSPFTTLDKRGIDVGFLRRDYWTFDEVAGLLTDAGELDDVFPVQNNTTYRAEVIADPEGTPVSLFTTAGDSSASIFLSRTRILRYTAGVRPATLRVEVTANHDVEGDNLDALQVLGQTFDTTASTIDDDFNFGVLNDGDVGGPWTAPTSGSYGFTVGTAPSTGAIQASINGGAYSTIIAAGNTTGTLAGVTAGDLIRVKHTQGGANTAETFLQIDAPSTALDGYAILIY